MLRIYSLLLIFLILISVSGLSVSSTNKYFARSITVYAPAVSRGGDGALLTINLTIKYPGSGRVYFSAKPLIELDTQATARIAAYVAATITGRDYYSYDYIVETTSTSLVVGGPSAGALITIGFTALFLNKTLNPWITMTGMINPDGSIGPVGGLLDKLEAVARNGYKVFLIPLGQRTVYVEERIVKHYPWGVYETIQYRPVDLVVEGERLGVTVVEVSNIFQALKYFLNATIEIGNMEINKPEHLLDEAKSYLDKNLEEINRLFNESLNMYSQLDIFSRINIYSRLRRVEDLSRELNNIASEGYTVYGVEYSYKVLRENIELNLLLKYLTNRFDLTSIEHYINDTLNNLWGRIASVNYLNQYVVEARREYYIAVYSYMDVLKSKNSLDTASLIDELADTLTSINKTQYYLELSKYTRSYSIDLNETIYTLYSIADSFISYAYSLARDIGGSNQYLAQAFNSYELAIKAYSENNTVAAYGLLIDTLVYADIGIEALFIESNDVFKNISLHLRNETIYYIKTCGLDNYTAYMVEAGDQALINNKSLETISYYLRAVMYIVTLSNKTGKPSFTETLPIIPRNNPSNPGYAVISSSGLKEIIYYLLGLLTGVILITLVLSLIRGRRETVIEHKPFIQITSSLQQ